MKKTLFFKASSSIRVDANDNIEELLSYFDAFVKCYPIVNYTYNGEHPSGKFVFSKDGSFNYEFKEYRFDVIIEDPDLNYINRLIDALSLMLLPMDIPSPGFCFEFS